MRAGFEAQREPLILYGVQLVLNFLWTPLFFKLHRPDVALVEIIGGGGAGAWARQAAGTRVRLAVRSRPPCAWHGSLSGHWVRVQCQSVSCNEAGRSIKGCAQTALPFGKAAITGAAEPRLAGQHMHTPYL